MPTYTNLALYDASDVDMPLSSEVMKPGVSDFLDQAGLYLNHAILASDVLFLDPRPAKRIVDAVFHADGRHFIPVDDVKVLREWLHDLRGHLANIVSPDGTPTSEENAVRLTASRLVEIDEMGRLYFLSRHLLLIDLIENMDAMIAMLDFAIENNLIVELA